MAVYKTKDYWFPNKKVSWNTISRCSKISNIFRIEYEAVKIFKVPVDNLSPSKSKKIIPGLIRQYIIPIGKI